MTGSYMIVRAESEEKAREWIANDIYTTGEWDVWGGGDGQRERRSLAITLQRTLNWRMSRVLSHMPRTPTTYHPRGPGGAWDLSRMQITSVFCSKDLYP